MLRLAFGEDFTLVFPRFVEPIGADRDVLRFAILIPDSSPGHTFEFFHERETGSEIPGFFGFLESCWLEQGYEKGLERIAGADSPSGDAVDAGIEEVEADVSFGK